MQLESPRSARALHRSRGLIVTATTTALLLVVAAVWSSAALALPPGGPYENRDGATVTVRKIVPPVGTPLVAGKIVDPGIVSFSGTGFQANEQVFVKIDDGAVRPTTAPSGGANAQDSMIVVTAAAGGTISGQVELAAVDPTLAPLVTSGKHTLRFISDRPRSIHGDFIVSAAYGGGPAAPNSGPTPATASAAVGPTAAQPVAWGGSFLDVPQLPVGSKLPFRLTGFPINAIVTVKVDDGNGATNPPSPRPDPLNSAATLGVDGWDRFRTDGQGNAEGFVAVPTTGIHAGTHWLRFLTTGGSVTAPYEIDSSNTGRTVAPAATVQRGRSLAVTGSGLLRDVFYRDGYRNGQTVTVRVDGGSPVQMQAGNDGTLTGSIPVPANTSLGTHAYEAWVGFHAGGDDPQVLIQGTFEVTEFVPDPVVVTPPVDTTPAVVTPPGTTPPATTPKPAAPTARTATISSSALKATKKGRFTLSLVRPGVATRVAVSVRTKSKIRVAGRKEKKVVTLVRTKTVTLKAGTAKQRTALSLLLTKEGRAALKKAKTLKVVVRVAPTTKGAKAVTKTVNLRG